MCKYKIKNCPAFNNYCNWCKDKQKHCKDIPDCLLKRIVESVKEQQVCYENEQYACPVCEDAGANELASEILEMLDIEE